MSFKTSPFKNIYEFDWDKGNITKSLFNHGVEYVECEQVFFNKPLLINYDYTHSSRESRFRALGRTDSNRYLFIIFTIRENKIRVISARDQSKKERKQYEKV